MPKVSMIGSFHEVEAVDAYEVVVGETFPLESLILDDAGHAVDLTGFTMSAAAEFVDADVKISRPGNTTELPVVSIEDLTLRQDAFRTLTATVTNATEGIAEVVIPPDLSPVNPAPATSRTVLAILYLTRTHTAVIRTTRIVLVYRRGAPT